MKAARFDKVILRRADLRRPFSSQFSRRLAGRTVLEVGRRAKYLVLPLSSRETLLMHLGMSGSFRVDRGPREAYRTRPAGDAADRHDHVVFHMSSGVIVTFNDPRRFGAMEIVPEGALATHPVFTALGPEPLAPEFDGFALARACRGKKTSLKAALLDQRVVAGLGNIYASEALYVARLSPWRRASTIATASGAPRHAAHALAAAIGTVLASAIERKAKGRYRSSAFHVYDRESEPCRRRGCGGTIRRRTQAGRSTFYCPRCQR
jgi:formamidopyrimidine-DNA glycosylase